MKKPRDSKKPQRTAPPAPVLATVRGGAPKTVWVDGGITAMDDWEAPIA